MNAKSLTDYLLRSLLFMGAWTLLGLLGMMSYNCFGGSSPVWPASGLGLAVLILGGGRYWPALLGGALLLGALSGMPPLVSLALAFTNLLESAGAAWLLRRSRFRPELSHARDLLRLAVVAAVFCLLSSALGVAVLGSAGVLPWDQALGSAGVWVFGNFLGVLLVAPLVLVWARPLTWTLSWRGALEGGLLALGLALVCTLLFFQPAVAASSRVPLAFLTFPFVVLAGLRFGLRGGTLSTLLVAGLAVLATARHLGVFVTLNLRDSTALLMMFEGMLALTALFVGVTRDDHRRQAEELRGNEQLFQGLAEANRLLLASPSWQAALPPVLESLGPAARLDRACLHRHQRLPDGRVITTPIEQWCAPDILSVTALPLLRDLDFSAHGLDRWVRLLAAGRPVTGTLEELPATEAALLATLDIRSIALAPILIEGQCWGFLGFEDCRRPRRWAPQELAVLQTVATNVGVAIRRDQLRDELATSVARHQALLSAMPDAYFLHDRHGTILDCSSQDPVGSRPDPADVLGRNHHQIFPPEVAAQIQRGFDEVAATGRPVMVQYSLGREGSQRHYERRLVRAEGDKYLAIVREVTEQRQADLERARIEHKLRETQRLESLGVLAGGIAHDFNNLLTAILGNANLARHALPPGTEVAAFLDHIDTASHRAADLCRQMLAYAGRSQFVIDTADLTQLARDTVPLLQLSISQRARFDAQFSPRPLPVLVDATQIRQILMNLIINAAESIEGAEGRITLRSGAMHADATYLAAARTVAEAEPGEYYYLEVVDNGCGMSPETLTHIFDPFFTTKFTGRGLGLAAVLGIMQGHHGALHVLSQPGAGSTFRVLFPPAPGVAPLPAPAETSAAAGPARGPGRPPGTVLLVDDEAGVRQTAAGVLDRLGFHTIVAAEGREALSLFEAAPASFHLVLLDLTMPGLDGGQVLAEMQRLRPDVPVIIMSGFSEEECGRRLQGRNVRAFLPKPFTLAQLHERLARVPL